MTETLEKIKTIRFGEIGIATDDIITMPKGIIGFSDLKRYIILDFHTEIKTALKWFQALNCPELAFILIDPYTFKPDYKVDTTDEEMQLLKAKTPDIIKVMTMVTIPQNPKKMTANLLGPIFINSENHLAMQVVLSNSEYTTSHYILPQENKLIDS